MAKRGTSTMVLRLRFPEFRRGAAWNEEKLEELIVTISPPVKLQTSSYRTAGKFPVIDQSQDAICGWTDDAQAVLEEPLPLIVFGDHTCVIKLVERPFAQGADGIKILAAKPVVLIEYLFHSLNHQPLVMEDYKRHFSTLKERRVFFPSIESGEQRKIADCLTSLDEVIAAQRRKVEALKAHKRGLMQQLFPREGETRPRHRFPEFRNAPEWKTGTVDTMISTVTPPQKIPTSGYGAEGLLPIVDQSPDPICGWTDDLDASIDAPLPLIVFGDHTCALKLVEHAFAQGADGIKIITAWPHIKIHFLYYALQIDPIVSTSYRRHFSLLQEKCVAFPEELAEQESIADCLSSLDTQITAESQQLAALKTHKRGLMQQLFPSPEEG